VYTGDFTEPLELGRQSKGEGEPYACQPQLGQARLIIAARDEPSISRKHLRIEALSEDRIQLQNLSATHPIRLPSGQERGPAASCEWSRPAFVPLGRRAIRVPSHATPEVPLQRLPEAALPPGLEAGSATAFPALARQAGVPLDSAVLLRWLQTALAVLQSAA